MVSAMQGEPQSGTQAIPPLAPGVGALLYTRHTLVLVLVCVSLVALLMTIGNVYLIWRSGTIYYTWLGAGIQLARPGEVPRQAIEALSLSMVRTLGNVNPEGIEAAVAAAKSVMTAQFRLRFDGMMAAQLPAMREAEITMLMQQPVVTRIDTRTKGGTTVYQAFITAERTIYVGDIALPPHRVVMMIESYPVIVEHANIYGLWVDDMHWPRLNIASGAIADVLATRPGSRRRSRRHSGSVIRE
jgi:hypothetical protein